MALNFQSHIWVMVIFLLPLQFFSLKDVLIIPNLSTNLLSIQKFVKVNKCSIEFDDFDFSMKDFNTNKILSSAIVLDLSTLYCLPLMMVLLLLI